MDTFEYHGYWRLPNQTKTIAGTLKFTPSQGGTLELLGSFEEIGGISNTNAMKHEIIHGYTPDGKYITLYKCINIHTSFSQPGYFTTKFYVNVIFIGIFFDTQEEITFKNISVNFLNLDEWLGLNFLNYRLSRSKKEHILKYKIPEIKKFTIGNMSLAIDFNLNVSTTQTRGSMQQTPYLKLEHDSEKHFDEFFKRIYELQNFLTFSMNAASYPIKVLGHNKKNEITVQNQTVHPEIHIFFRTQTSEVQKFNPYLILFNYHEISRSFKIIIRTWFEYTEKYQSIIDLYFGTFYQEEMYNVHRFTSLINSLEGYHRLRYGDKTEMPVRAYDKMLKNILTKVSIESNRKWLAEKLTYANELTLRKRVKKTLNRIDFIPMSGKDKQELTEKIIDTRNYYTHYDDSLKDKAAKGIELHSLNNKLNIMLQLCLMIDLKISINERVKENLEKLFKEGNDI